MSEINQTPSLSLATRTELPLVPYFTDARLDSEAYAGRIVDSLSIPGSSLPVMAVRQAFHASYVTRFNHARQTDVPDKVNYLEQILRHEPTSDYIVFRHGTDLGHPTIGARVEAFMHPPVPGMTAYEIFSRARNPDEGDFYDYSVPGWCLEAIAKSLGTAPHDEPVRTPAKLLDKSEYVDRVNYRVVDFGTVATKYTAGSIRLENGVVQVKSRTFGVFDFAGLHGGKQRIANRIARHDPRHGLTEDLAKARAELDQILKESPERVHPVIESIYVSRVPETDD